MCQSVLSIVGCVCFCWLETVCYCVIYLGLHLVPPYPIIRSLDLVFPCWIFFLVGSSFAARNAVRIGSWMSIVGRSMMGSSVSLLDLLLGRVIQTCNRNCVCVCASVTRHDYCYLRKHSRQNCACETVNGTRFAVVNGAVWQYVYLRRSHNKIRLVVPGCMVRSYVVSGQCG